MKKESGREKHKKAADSLHALPTTSSNFNHTSATLLCSTQGRQHPNQALKKNPACKNICLYLCMYIDIDNSLDKHRQSNTKKIQHLPARTGSIKKVKFGSPVLFKASVFQPVRKAKSPDLCLPFHLLHAVSHQILEPVFSSPL